MGDGGLCVGADGGYGVHVMRPSGSGWIPWSGGMALWAEGLGTWAFFAPVGWGCRGSCQSHSWGDLEFHVFG